MSSLHIIDHPLAGDCLRILRNRQTGTRDFRSAMDKLSLVLAVEATKDLKYSQETVITPLDTGADCLRVQDDRVLLVPILRAGLGFLNSFLQVLPEAKVAHIGVSRDHDTLEACPYCNSVPPESDGSFDTIFVLDPMLATGNSSVKTLEMIIEKGYQPGQIKLVCAVSVKKGINQVHSRYPEIKILTAVVDAELNEKAYIVPGLGDAGDRLYLL
ncbi:uracil phosphoribosyltransferase [Desulfotomaculum arcticum]|uniref:Uracil phosphoribosyltransferase n=1 Tax=Desulfotruncus arcticus DSM 17038 TaxID=1121424 RepID=A0A1I2U769_9FIRM|nr:uracil phosphoribosyltransferase [Desulfotruncus arcticus]SFG72209.1 uracil phosphoribosyltransferase [Desulfotomaculum arcticum] [Desulfotruncus arcticus DSM 17038]